jgi:hypothetical protein
VEFRLDFPTKQAHKKKGHGIHLKYPIMGTSLHLAGTLFVDDTDIERFNMNRRETVWGHTTPSKEVLSTGHLLIVTGGALKPSICFFI